MANPEHVAIVRKGAAAIDEWQEENRVVLDLYGADLSGIDLREANLADADMRKANLSKTNLAKANLSSANFDDSILTNVEAPRARFSLTSLVMTDLSGSNLFKASTAGSHFVSCNLSNVNFAGADLGFALFCDCTLSEANFSSANLYLTNVTSSSLHNSNLARATFSSTTISDCDLSNCKGLEDAKHEGPSWIGIDTLVKSFRGAGNQFTSELETFFVNAGVPKEILDSLPKILASVQYCSCFIAYGEPDKAFAERLVKDLKAKGVSCWIYSLDAIPGERTWLEISQRRREAEKMIVLCSAKALIRDGVLKEIEEQIDEDPDKIVPISLDDTWKQDGFVIRRGHREDLKTFLLERNYADFCDESKYAESLSKLLKGIRREK